MTTERPAYAWRPVALVVAVQAALLLAMAPHYGPHRDELYFVSAGQRLAWGYPDQPSFTPLLARLSTELAEHNLVVLRLWSILAVAGLVLLAVQFARLLGGARSAQVLTAVTVAASAVVMTVGHRLSTATFDTLAWTAVLVLVTQALVDDRPRLWLVAGVVAGIGLNNKHAVAFLLLGILVALALDRHSRRGAARPRGPGSPAAYAVLLWVPNLIWQWRHDWPALELSADIAEEYGGLGGRLGMVGEAFSMFSPFLGVLWVIGLVQLLRRDDWRAARLPAFVFLVVTAVFLVTGGKGYYLAGAIVPLLAAGCTWLAEKWSGRTLVLAGAGLAASAMVAWPALVPVLPVQTFADSFYTELNDDQAETIGWPEYAADRPRRSSPASPTASSSSPATTARPARSSGTTSARRSSAGTTAGGTGDLRSRRPCRWSSSATTTRRPDFAGCDAGRHAAPATWTSTTRSRAHRCGSATGRSARGRSGGTSSSHYDA